MDAAIDQEIKELNKQTAQLDKQNTATEREIEKMTAQYEERKKQKAEERERIAFKAIPRHIRMEHCLVVGGSGSGKTSLIQDLVIEDLFEAISKPPNPAILIIDPKGELVSRLSRLLAFAPGYYLENKLVVIDPTKRPLPALDIFHHPTIQGDEYQRTRVLNHLIETFAYIFSLSNAQLTQRQSIPFTYVVRLVFSMHGNLETMMDILEDNPKDRRFYPYMQKLGEQDAGARRFFENDFYTVAFNETRQQIKTRLYEIISKQEIMAMFAAGQNKLSLFDCMQQRKIVLVNTAMPFLGSRASQLLGRYFIASALNAAFARSGIPKAQWNEAYLIIDEFQNYSDEEKTPEMLRLAREYNLGISVIVQNLFCAEFNDNIRNAISTNTSIKYASSPEGTDLNYIARDMRCEPEFLTQQAVKSGGTAAFAVYARGMGLKHPFIRSFELGGIEKSAKMSDDVYTGFMQAQRDALKPDPKPQPSITTHPIKQPSEPEPTKPLREPDIPTEPHARRPPTDPHTGDHTEPAAKWGDQ